MISILINYRRWSFFSGKLPCFNNNHCGLQDIRQQPVISHLRTRIYLTVQSALPPYTSGLHLATCWDNPYNAGQQCCIEPVRHLGSHDWVPLQNSPFCDVDGLPVACKWVYERGQVVLTCLYPQYLAFYHSRAGFSRRDPVETGQDRAD